MDVTIYRIHKTVFNDAFGKVVRDVRYNETIRSAVFERRSKRTDYEGYYFYTVDGDLQWFDAIVVFNSIVDRTIKKPHS